MESPVFHIHQSYLRLSETYASIDLATDLIGKESIEALLMTLNTSFKNDIMTIGCNMYDGTLDDQVVTKHMIIQNYVQGLQQVTGGKIIEYKKSIKEDIIKIKKLIALRLHQLNMQVGN